jgi:hypothetical protein
MEDLLRIQGECASDVVDEEFYVLITHLIHCAGSWEVLLSEHEIPRAVIVISQSVDVGWCDEDVINRCNDMPSWYEGPSRGAR